MRKKKTRERPFEAEILKLRSEGKLFREIQDTIGCDTSTISKALNPKYRENRNEKSKAWWKNNPIYGKCSNYNTRGTVKGSVTVEDVLKKFGDKPTCYLTGKKIDWSQRDTYSFDHVVPIARGGTSTIENCQIIDRDANQLKGRLLPTEALDLCHQVLEHHGYTVTKSNHLELR